MMKKENNSCFCQYLVILWQDAVHFLDLLTGNLFYHQSAVVWCEPQPHVLPLLASERRTAGQRDLKEKEVTQHEEHRYQHVISPELDCKFKKHSKKKNRTFCTDICRLVSLFHTETSFGFSWVNLACRFCSASTKCCPLLCAKLMFPVCSEG